MLPSFSEISKAIWILTGVLCKNANVKVIDGHKKIFILCAVQ